MNFKIMGKDWTICVLNKKKYKKKHGMGTLAVTHREKRYIDINTVDSLEREVVMHELLHAYSAELCIDSMDLDSENYEEFFAELFSKRGYEILAVAEDLFWRLKDENS